MFNYRESYLAISWQKYATITLLLLIIQLIVASHGYYVHFVLYVLLADGLFGFPAVPSFGCSELFPLARAIYYLFIYFLNERISVAKHCCPTTSQNCKKKKKKKKTQLYWLKINFFADYSK